MKSICLWVSICSLVLVPLVHAQSLDILVIGSSHSFSEGKIGNSGVAHEKPFNPTTIATHLQGILSQDTAITAVTPAVNVVFEDILRSQT